MKIVITSMKSKLCWISATQQPILLLHQKFCSSSGCREWQSEFNWQQISKPKNAKNIQKKIGIYSSSFIVVFVFNSATIALAPSSEILFPERLEKIKERLFENTTSRQANAKPQNTKTISIKLILKLPKYSQSYVCPQCLNDLYCSLIRDYVAVKTGGNISNLSNTSATKISTKFIKTVMKFDNTSVKSKLCWTSMPQQSLLLL